MEYFLVAVVPLYQFDPAVYGCDDAVVLFLHLKKCLSELSVFCINATESIFDYFNDYPINGDYKYVKLDFFPLVLLRRFLV